VPLPATPMVPEIEVIVKMCPVFCARITGSTARVTFMVPKVFVSNCFFDELEGGLFEQTELAVAGVVHEHVDAAEAREGRLDALPGLLFVGDVEGQREEIVGGAEGGFDGFGLSCGGDDEVVGGECCLDGFGADAAVGAGDEPDFLL
jgi:hypothetical protein